MAKEQALKEYQRVYRNAKAKERRLKQQHGVTVDFKLLTPTEWKNAPNKKRETQKLDDFSSGRNKKYDYVSLGKESIKRSEYQKIAQENKKVIDSINYHKKKTLKRVLDKPYMVMGSDGVLRYYNRSDGKFYRLDAQGNLVALSDTVFHKVQNVTWASNGEKAILEYPDGNKIVYDFNKQKQVTLPKHWQDFSFSPNGQQISAKSIAYDVENRHLIVANADGSKAKSLSPIGENADKVYPIWSPNNQAAAMYLGGVDFNRQEVFFVGLNDENFKSTIVNGRGFEPKWSTEGDRLLYSVYNSDNRMNPTL